MKKKYLISSSFKKNKMWGIFFCRVFLIQENMFIEVTEQLKETFEYNNGSLKIPFGSWTWFSRIKYELEKKHPNEQIRCFDVSPVF